ncbi:hypothetical protein CEXT_730081 [Caerostris extrusa]|uniref:Uncharacterized protein n=1 Tax=Caerostris extrusa TaxID=172846 RepID=A0AAV4N9J7_CAEEX|nr:hypothetical protein CEXT_730081 [Caerostris extrusa]
MATEFHMSPLQMSNDLSLERNDPTIRHRPFSAGETIPNTPFTGAERKENDEMGCSKGFWGGGVRCAWVESRDVWERSAPIGWRRIV